MRCKRAGVSLTNKVSIGFAVLLVLTSVYTYSMLYLPTVRITRSQVESSLKAVSAQAASQIDTILRQVETVSDIIQINKNYTRMLKVGNLDYLDQIKNYWTLNQELNTIKNYFTHLNIEIYIPGQSLLSYENIIFFSLESIGGESWINEVTKKKGRLYWTSDLTVKGQNNADIPAVSAVRLMDDHFLKIGVHQSALEHVLTSAVQNLDIALFIVDQDGRQLFSTGGAQLPAAQDSDAFHIFHDPIPTNGWELVTAIPNPYLNSELNRLQLPYALGMLLLLCCFLVVTFLVSVSIKRRIHKIDQVLSQVERQNYSSKIQIGQFDELSRLEKRINVFIDRIQILMLDLVGTERAKKEMELNMLQAQIEPHFIIYNALDSINWMALDSGNSQISQAIVNLAMFLRKNFARGEELVTIADELDHIRLYLEIMKNRSDCQFTLTVDIPENMRARHAIKFTFQPIVENAVIHGFLKDRRQTGTLLVSGTAEDGMNVIRIEDNGAGFNREQTHYTGGFGLKSVEERLRLHFGGDSSLTVKSREGQGTSVRLTWRYQ